MSIVNAQRFDHIEKEGRAMTLPNTPKFYVELDGEVQFVNWALRVLEKPIESSTEDIENACLILKCAIKVKSEWYLPFQVNLAVETANRGWGAIYSLWQSGDRKKAIVVLRAVETTRVWCGGLDRLLKAIACDWDEEDEPDELAIEAMRYFCRSACFTVMRDGHFSPEVWTAWMRKAPDPRIFLPAVEMFLKFCKRQAIGSRWWMLAFHHELWKGIVDLLRHPPFVDAFITAIPKMYPHMTDIAIANRAKIIRDAASNPLQKLQSDSCEKAWIVWNRFYKRKECKSGYPIGRRDNMRPNIRKVCGWKPR
jgi:hypothetical protein